jgi:CubicO group peptidase (beta-lactamase class C family)
MFGPWPKYFTYYLGDNPPASCEDTTRLMMTMPLRYKPGTTFSYSNLNYCILGLIINKITQQPYGAQGYEDYIRNQILLPLGIERMQIGSTDINKSVPGEVHYYKYPEPAEVLAKLHWENYLPYANSEILQKDFSAAGWIASTQDLARFVYALSQHRIISTSMLWVMMQRPSFVDRRRKSYYTMGMKLEEVKTEKYWIMTGSFNGTNAYIIRKPNGTIITVLFNSRAPTYALFSRFRPQLNRLLLGNVVF